MASAVLTEVEGVMTGLQSDNPLQDEDEHAELDAEVREHDSAAVTIAFTLRRWFGGSSDAYNAELFGTFFLTVTYVCAEVTEEATYRIAAEPLALLLLMTGFASVSGGHFNPAVSLSVGLANKGSWRVLGRYMLLQFFGGFLGCWFATAIYGLRAKAPQPQHIEHANREDYAGVSAFMVEWMFTTLWCFVHLNVTLSQGNNPIGDGNQFFGVALGLIFLAGNLEGQQVSGAFFNPAIAFGVTMPRFGASVGWMFLFFLAYVLAALTAALLFRLMRSKEDTKLEVRQQPIPRVIVSEGIGAFTRTYLFGMGIGEKDPVGAISSGAAVAALSYAVSDVSGAHFNPVVTVSVLCNGSAKLSWQRGVAYILTQLVFSFTAASLYSIVHQRELYGDNATRKMGRPAHWFRTLSGEFFFSVLLGYVVLTTMLRKCIDTPSSRNHFFGLAVGSTVALAGVTLHSTAGGCVNPATVLASGAALPVNKAGTSFTWASVATELFGGAVAAGLFSLLHEERFCEFLDDDETPAKDSADSSGEKAALPQPETETESRQIEASV